MDNYFYVDPQGQKNGPVPANQLVGYGVTADTLVWKAGMDQWEKASNVPELAQFLSPSSAQTPPIEQPAQQGKPHTSSNNSGSMQMMPKPDTYLVWTILSTILCCLPIGAYAIYCSTRVDSLYMAGNYAEAQKQSANAKKWTIIAAVVGVVASIIYLIIYFGIIAAALSSSSYY